MNKPIVFCVEDNKNDILFMQRVFDLMLKKFDCFFHTNVSDSIDFLYKAYVDNKLPMLMLVDIKLINSNGLDLLKYTKQDFRYKDIPIVILSSSDLKEDKMIAKKYGCNDYIEKPKNYQDMKSKLVEVVNLWSKRNKI